MRPTHILYMPSPDYPRLKPLFRIGPQKWIDNDESSSDDGSSHGTNDQEKEKKGHLQVPLRPSLYPPRPKKVAVPPRPSEPNRKPGSPVFQHGKAMRGRNHVPVASPSKASSLRGRAGLTSRITDRSSVSPTRGVKPKQQYGQVSPSAGVESKHPVLGPRPASRVGMVPSPTKESAPVDRGAAATPSDASHEAEDIRPLTVEDMTPDVRGAGQTGAGSHTAGVPLSTEHIFAVNMAMGLPAHEKGGRFDMLSSNVSFSDSEEGSSSEIDVCDFLEAPGSLADGGGPPNGSGGDGVGQHGGGGTIGEMARRYLSSEGDGFDSSDEEDPQGLQDMEMDAQDIAFLVESRELREVMLGLEGLHFGETKRLLLVGVWIHGRCV